MICSAKKSDLSEISNVHLAVFKNFFLSSLGFYFLKELYRGFLTTPSGILLVAKQDNSTLGFAAGTTNPKYFFSSLRRRRFIFFIVKAIPGIIKNPTNVLKKLFYAMFYSGESPKINTEYALLSSIGVIDSYRGTMVAKELLQAFEQEVLRQGVAGVYLTTDAQNNDRAITFYQKHGYTLTSTFLLSNNREMICFQKSLMKTQNTID